MTEPGAGSDLAGIRTRAVPHGQGWRINGQKILISNGQLADLVLLAAKTDPKQGARGVSLLLVDTQPPGYSRGRRLEKLGMLAQDTSDLFFTDVDVGPDALLGPAGSGFKAMMKELPQEAAAGHRRRGRDEVGRAMDARSGRAAPSLRCTLVRQANHPPPPGP